MAQQLALVLALVAAVPLGAAGHAFQGAKERGFLAAGMRPELVAQKLVGVEDEWLAMADSFLTCGSRNHTEGEGEAPCAESQQGFFRSCATVVSAMVQGSGGDQAVVKEYMDTVCSKGPLEGWRQNQCLSLAAHVNSAMSVDAYDNREDLNITGLCQKYWVDFTAEEGKIVAQREAEEQKKEEAEAEERKKEEEAEAAERKKAEEAEEKAKEEAAKEAKAKAAEEAKAKAEEAQSKAAQAKAAAEDAAKSLEAKRAEAEKMMADAKQAAELRKNITASANQTAPAAHEAGSVSVTNATTNPTTAPANATKVASSPAKTEDVADAAKEALARADRALSSSS